MNTKNAKYAKLNADGRQLERLMRAFIATRKGDEVTGMDLCAKCDEYWGIRIDWHDWCDLLEKLAYDGIVTETRLNASRMEKYIIN